MSCGRAASMQMGGSAAEQDPHKAARPVRADGGELLNMSVLVWVAARAGLGEGGLVNYRYHG